MKIKFEDWLASHRLPYHFPVDEANWYASMKDDVDSDGRKLFLWLKEKSAADGMIQYGETAFGFDESGEISSDVHYPVIRDLVFSSSQTGQKLLETAIEELGTVRKLYAFFHYFGMSCCARHGKLHESQHHIHELLLKNGFQIEHENVYYSKVLTPTEGLTGKIELKFQEVTPGGCRSFAAVSGNQEVCWGQIHFLPQGEIAYLRWIYTDASHQHQGIGTQVMEALFSALCEMGIRRFDTDTARDNVPAQKFYEKCGFCNEGITRSYHT